MCDTNILVRAVITPGGAAAELLRLVATEHLLVTSSYQLSELWEVLQRPPIRALHRLDDGQLQSVLTELATLAIVVPLPADVPLIVAADPKDNPIILTAICGHAEVLCTLDRHLFSADVIAYCNANGLRVVKDAELLTELRGA